MHITGGVRGTPKMRDANSEYSGWYCLSQPQKCAAVTTQQWLMARGSEHCAWQHLARTNTTITCLLVSLCWIIPAWSLEGEKSNCARLLFCRFSLFVRCQCVGLMRNYHALRFWLHPVFSLACLKALVLLPLQLLAQRIQGNSKAWMLCCNELVEASVLQLITTFTQSISKTEGSVPLVFELSLII